MLYGIIKDEMILSISRSILLRSLCHSVNIAFALKFAFLRDNTNGSSSKNTFLTIEQTQTHKRTRKLFTFKQTNWHMFVLVWRIYQIVFLWLYACYGSMSFSSPKQQYNANAKLWKSPRSLCLFELSLFHLFHPNV